MNPLQVNSKQIPSNMLLSWQNFLHPLPKLTRMEDPFWMDSLQLTTWLNGPDRMMLEYSHRDKKFANIGGRI
jgi:hypothetical protein